MTTLPGGGDVDRRRRDFHDLLVRPVPAGLTVRATELGGRPAIELTGAGEAGTLLWFHGGGYWLGEPGTTAALAADIAVRAGLRVVSVDYRLAPEHPFPAGQQDALAAYRAILADLAPEALVVGGESAGGGITLATLLGARDEGLPQPAAAVVLSPWVDLTLSGDSARTKEGVDPIFTRDALLTTADLYAPAERRREPLVSPVFADLHGLPPLLVQAGADELLLDDATRLATRAAADDVEVTLQVWGRMPHVFMNRPDERPAGLVALDEAGRFISRHLMPTPAGARR